MFPHPFGMQLPVNAELVGTTSSEERFLSRLFHSNKIIMSSHLFLAPSVPFDGSNLCCFCSTLKPESCGTTGIKMLMDATSPLNSNKKLVRFTLKSASCTPFFLMYRQQIDNCCSPEILLISYLSLCLLSSNGFGPIDS